MVVVKCSKAVSEKKALNTKVTELLLSSQGLYRVLSSAISIVLLCGLCVESSRRASERTLVVVQRIELCRAP